MKMKGVVLGFLGVVFVAGAAAAQPLNTPFQIYMQADGDTECHLDTSEMMMKKCGRSPSRPVTTLSQVQTILANHLFDKPDWSTRVNANVEVRISATEPYYCAYWPSSVPARRAQARRSYGMQLMEERVS